jgi:hypothetical protein
MAKDNNTAAISKDIKQAIDALVHKARNAGVHVVIAAAKYTSSDVDFTTVIRIQDNDPVAPADHVMLDLQRELLQEWSEAAHAKEAYENSQEFIAEEYENEQSAGM